MCRYAECHYADYIYAEFHDKPRQIQPLPLSRMYRNADLWITALRLLKYQPHIRTQFQKHLINIVIEKKISILVGLISLFSQPYS